MKKLFAILLICILSLPVIAIEEQEAGFTPINEDSLEIITPEEEIGEISVPQSTFEQNTLPPPIQNPNNKFKSPLSKKKLAKKFITAMVCVAGTSIFLYVTLTLYNKFRESYMKGHKPTLPEGEQPLETPCDLTDAVKTFVEKTRWDN